MALKDLTSDLSNFKYGLTSPDKIDKQIEKGVDFFPNDDADGFTPKTDLESRFKRVPTGIDKQIENGVDFFSNNDAIGFVTNNPNLPSDFQLPSSPKSGDVGITINDGESPGEIAIGTEAAGGSFFHMVRDGVVGKKWPEAAISYDKDRFGSFDKYSIPSNYEQKMVEEFDTFYPTWENTTQFTSPFMTTPLSDYVSRYPTNPSLTWGDEDGTMLGPVGLRIQPQFTSPFMATPILGYESRYVPVGNVDFSLTWNEDPRGIMTGPVAGVPISYEKTRDVYQHHFLDSPFENISLNTDLFSPVGGWKLGSINIFPNDVKAPIGNDNLLGTDLNRITSPSTNFLNPLITNPSVSSTLAVNPINSSQQLSGRITAKSDYTGAKNVGPFIFTGDNVLDLNTMTSSDKIASITELHRFSSENGGTRQFLNVPAGLDPNMNLITKPYREVSDPFNIAGFAQPFILRPFPDDDGVAGPGNGRWGFDAITSETGIVGTLLAGADGLLGGFFRGAPTFTGLIERNIVDKIRLGKFLLSPAGIGFLGKQFVLQGLNPTIESKVYNPISALNIPLGVITDPEGAVQAGGVSGLAALIASVALPIAHTERHLGGARYESMILGTGGSRIANQARAFSIGNEVIDEVTSLIPSINTGISFFDNFVNTNINNLISTLDAATITPIFGLSNPNKYAFPFSSAPKSVKDGNISFFGSADLALADVESALGRVVPGTTNGGTFNDQTANNLPNDEDGLVKRHSTLSYNELNSNNSYGTSVLVSPSEKKELELGIYPGGLVAGAENRLNTRLEGKDKNDDIGNPASPAPIILEKDLGLIKGDTRSANVDAVNITPYAATVDGEIIHHNYNKGGIETKDFIKFRFKDVVNNKYIIFRAILDGISDTITPEYGEERYIGRPDKVYVYQGTDRSVAFNFKVYPKTKQEMPILLEKMNYLVGLCYPSYTKGERMITPFMELTMGDMFVDTPGLMESVTVTVEDATTWEIENGLQFPHFISVACTFKHIGKYILAGKGKHYDLGWLADGAEGTQEQRFGPQIGIGFNNFPNRTKYRELFSQFGQAEYYDLGNDGQYKKWENPNNSIAETVTDAAAGIGSFFNLGGD